MPKERLQRLVSEREQARKNLANLDEQIDDTTCALLNEALPEIDCIAPGLHNCATSPTGYCAYDHMEDPMSDFCLFCGDPHERK